MDPCDLLLNSSAKKTFPPLSCFSQMFCHSNEKLTHHPEVFHQNILQGDVSAYSTASKTLNQEE
jgi:hypothetical protein